MDDSRNAFRAVGALADTARRRLYDYVAAQPHPVGREEAAAGVGVPVHSARFHLDRLVAEGLLETEFRRLTGRSGPGAGRPAKLYRRAAGQVSVTLPPRNYDLVGQVLAAAVQRSLSGAPLAEALVHAARAAGEQDAARCGQRGDELARIGAVLTGRGFEPRPDERGLVLRNCPFDALAREHTALVCGVNRDYVGGVVDGLGCVSACAVLDPAPERCCVRVEHTV